MLTTHYLEEAEELADRVGVIDRGRLLVVEDTEALLSRHGAKVLRLALARPISALPAALSAVGARLAADGTVVTFEASAGDAFGPAPRGGRGRGARGADVETRRTTLEDVFVRLVSRGPRRWRAVISLGLWTLLQKEVRRFLRVPGQTLLSPAR